MTNIPNNLSETLKGLREKEGYTKKKIGDYLKMTPEGYGHYETGKRTPGPEVIKQLAELYGVTADYILGIEHERYLDIKNSAPEVGTPEWLRFMYEQLGINVDGLSDAQISVLVDNSNSLAQMFRDKLAEDNSK